MFVKVYYALILEIDCAVDMLGEARFQHSATETVMLPFYNVCYYDKP